MNLLTDIENYLSSLPKEKSSDMRELHRLIQEWLPGARLWFESGKNEEGKVVSNPNIGYGQYTIHYANGTSREFFQIGLSANTTGISVYIMGLKDKNYLKEHFAKDLGKASVTGYCIKFKSIKDVSLEVLKDSIHYGVKSTSE